MTTYQTKKNAIRRRRTLRVRKKVQGTSLKPRLSVVKTNKHIQVQLIDDENGKTIASASTFSKEFRSTEFNKKNKASAQKLGESIAKDAEKLNVKEVIFDRGRFKYHGILAELANAARQGGMKF